MQQGSIHDPTGLIYKNETVNDSGTSGYAEPKDILPKIDGSDDASDAISGIPAWVWIILGMLIMYLKQKGETFKVVSLNEVNDKIVEYARLHEGIRGLHKMTLGEVYDGVFAGTYEVTSCLRENKGGFGLGDKISVKYLRAKGVRDFSKTSYDPRKPKFIAPDTHDTPAVTGSKGGMLDNLRNKVLNKSGGKKEGEDKNE